MSQHKRNDERAPDSQTRDRDERAAYTGSSGSAMVRDSAGNWGKGDGPASGVYGGLRPENRETAREVAATDGEGRAEPSDAGAIPTRLRAAPFDPVPRKK